MSGLGGRIDARSPCEGSRWIGAGSSDAGRARGKSWAVTPALGELRALHRRAVYNSAVSQSHIPASLRHKRASRPLHFPTDATVPETKRHLELRTLLFLFLKHNFAGRAIIGCDQFVYFRATDPRKCVAPDGFIRLGRPDITFDSWKTWEHGAPELCIEIASESDARSWEDKLAAYNELGVLELVRLDPDAVAEHQLSVWDRLDGDLVERIVEGTRTPCLTLGGRWCVLPYGEYRAALRLEDDSGALLLTREEAAEQRIVELEAELARRRG